MEDKKGRFNRGEFFEDEGNEVPITLTRMSNRKVMSDVNSCEATAVVNLGARSVGAAQENCRLTFAITCLKAVFDSVASEIFLVFVMLGSTLPLPGQASKEF
jgi:hypothetical protein